MYSSKNNVPTRGQTKTKYYAGSCTYECCEDNLVFRFGFSAGNDNFGIESCINNLLGNGKWFIVHSERDLALSMNYEP